LDRIPYQRKGIGMSWKVEVVADSTGKWCGNSLVFPTEEEALGYGNDLKSRWMSVRKYRAVESDEPVTHSFDLGTGKCVYKDTKAKACNSRRKGDVNNAF
jgi:hypothetical protein